MKIAVVGGGAAGLTAAIAANRQGAEVIILEQADRVGKKLLATGNGRCNLTNIYANRGNFYGDVNFLEPILSKFNPEWTMSFFESIGIVCRVAEEGRVYPYSLQASSVLDLLRLASNAEERCNYKVSKIRQKSDKLIINEDITVDKVIVTTGGKAAPNLSGGGAYELLTSLGHSLTPLKPSLVQLKTNSTFNKQLKGIKVNATVYTKKRCETGEVLFTEYGLSGPPILQLSRHVEKNDEIKLDLTPDLSFEQIVDILNSRKGLKLNNIFTGFLNKQLGLVLLKSANISGDTSCLKSDDIKKLATIVKGFSFIITGDTGWQNAQVTAGGIMTKDFNENLESKKVKNLYAAGEIFNIDGDCGGYNLQWAWASGFLAGYSAGGRA